MQGASPSKGFGFASIERGRRFRLFSYGGGGTYFWQAGGAESDSTAFAPRDFVVMKGSQNILERRKNEARYDWNWNGKWN